MPEMANVHRQPNLGIIGSEFRIPFNSQALDKVVLIKTSKVRTATQDCFDSSFKVSGHREDRI